jgi:two-component system nitrate/nitrite sensor histidine kinase NarX
LQWVVLAAALASVLAVEVLRRNLVVNQVHTWWLWPLALILGVLIFTRLVFRKLEAMDRILRTQEQRTEKLFNTTAVGMVLVGRGCHIEKLNPAAEHLTGWTARELVGRSVCSDLFANGPDGMPICFNNCLSTILRDTPEPLNGMTLLTRDGKELEVAVCATALSEGEFALLFWDMSERTRLERELARRRRQAEQLYEVGREMATMVDLDRNLERLLAKAREVMEADVAGWGTLDDASLELSWQLVVGAVGEFARVPLGLKETVTGRVLSAGRPYVTQNLAADVTANEPAEARVLSEGLVAAMAVPLQVRDRHYGVLFIGHRRRVRMNDEDLLLLSNLGSHLSIAVENNDLLLRMQHMAALEERQRLAREMHDSFGQILTYVGMRLHLMESMAGEGGELQAEIGDLLKELHNAHQDVRKSIYQLKDSGPPLAPLWDRWAEHLRLFERQTGIKVEMSGREAVPAHLPERAESQMTRVIQEALVNVRNHSGAGKVLLEAYRDGHNLCVQLRDDGCGFETGQASGPGEYHFGLSIMRERIATLGGVLEILSEPGHGTQVRMTVPVPAGGGNNHVGVAAAQNPAGR